MLQSCSQVHRGENVEKLFNNLQMMLTRMQVSDINEKNIAPEDLVVNTHTNII